MTKRDLDERADVVMLFPQEMMLPHGNFPPEAATKPAPPLREFQLREPKSLKTLMHMLTKPGTLEREAERVVEHPVRDAQDYRVRPSPHDRPGSLNGSGS